MCEALFPPGFYPVSDVIKRAVITTVNRRPLRIQSTLTTNILAHTSRDSRDPAHEATVAPERSSCCWNLYDGNIFVGGKPPQVIRTDDHVLKSVW